MPRRGALPSLPTGYGGRSSILVNRQHPRADARVIEDNHRTVLENFAYSRQVRSKKQELPFGTSLGVAAEENYRRFRLPSQSEQRAEIGICRDYDPILMRSSSEYCFIGSVLQAVVPHVHRVVPGAAKPLCHFRRQRVVDEKLHGAARGSSRSRTASAAYFRDSQMSASVRSG